MSAQATLVIEFGSGADSAAFVAMELDEVFNVDSDGAQKTKFEAGDQWWFWLQHEVSLRIGAITPTSGMVVDCGQAVRSRSQEITWTASNPSQELSHIPSSAPKIIWYGNEGSGMQRNGRTVTVAGNLPCTADVEMPIDVHLYRFVPPPLTLADEATFRVVVVITMEAAA